MSQGSRQALQFETLHVRIDLCCTVGLLDLREAHVLVHHAPPARAVGAADALARLGVAVGVEGGAGAVAERAGVWAAAAAEGHVWWLVGLNLATFCTVRVRSNVKSIQNQEPEPVILILQLSSGN